MANLNLIEWVLLAFIAFCLSAPVFLFFSLKKNTKEREVIRLQLIDIEKQIVANANRNDPLVRILLGEMK